MTKPSRFKQLEAKDKIVILEDGDLNVQDDGRVSMDIHMSEEDSLKKGANRLINREEQKEECQAS